MIWIGVLACAFFPRNRSAVALVLMIPPFVGCILLLKLTESAEWGVIVAAWLVRPKALTPATGGDNNCRASPSLTSIEY